MCLRRLPYPLNFNPRSHEGSDTLDIFNHASVSYFNPRSHEGSDRMWQLKVRQRPDFNPRSHEGSDSCITCQHIFWRISIHAPTRGATDLRDQGRL